MCELKSLRSDFGTRFDGIDQKLAGMTNTLATLEVKVNEMRQEVVDNTARIEQAEARIEQAETRIDEMETVQGETVETLKSALKRITQLENKTDDLENRGRRKNLRVFGIREKAEGTRPLIDFMKEMLPKWLGLPPHTFTLERVHRTLAPSRPNQHRAVLVRFLKFQEKEFVYQEAKKTEIKHDGLKITFVHDLSAETLRVRKGFQPVIQRFVDINAFRGFQYYPCKLRILHNGKIHLFSTPQQAEDFYKSLPAQVNTGPE